MKEIKLTTPKKKIRVYTEVMHDYTDPETGDIAIDVYETDKPNETGKILAWVTPDGKILLGENATGLEPTLDCTLVREAIAQAISAQKEIKQALVDEVLEEQKEHMECTPGRGDFTVIDELLMFVPFRNLVQALGEERWTEYPSDFSKNEEE